MKIKKLIIGLSVLGSLSLGVAGVVSATLSKKEPVKAEAATYTGSFYVKCQDFWMAQDASIAIYLFNSNSSMWCSNLLNPNGSTYYKYEYSLSFQPTAVICSRIYKNSTPGDWCFDVDNGGVFSRTNDIDLNDTIWLGSHYQGSKYTTSGSYSLETYVKGGASENWSQATVNTQLTNTQTDGSKIEVFGTITVPADTYFKVVKTGVNPQEWYGNYTCDGAISSYLTGGGSSNIRNKALAKFDFYFNFDGNTTYIQSASLKAADTWCQSFNTNVGCDPTGQSLPTGWSSLSSSYSSLSGDAKDTIYASAANASGSNIERAMHTYDYAVSHHSSLTKFVTNSSGVVRNAAPIAIPTALASGVVDNSSVIAIVVIISVVAVPSIGAYFFVFKKRKQD